MEGISNNKYRLPTANELNKLDLYEVEFSRQVAFAIKWAYNVHGWKGRDIEERIPGVKASVWQRYAQPAYTKARSLHVIAAFSWVSQISMSAILYGDRIAQYWPNASRKKIEIFIFSGLMKPLEFDYFIKKLLSKTVSETKFNEAYQRLEHLHNYIDLDCHAPDPLDLDAFADDYYRSIASTLKTFRQSCGFSVPEMALSLNLSDYKYRTYEDSDHPPKSIPLHLAARLKLAFKIPDTVPFLSNMNHFPGFTQARKTQQARELLLIQALEGVRETKVSKLVEFAQELTQLEKNKFGCAVFKEGTHPKTRITP